MNVTKTLPERPTGRGVRGQYEETTLIPSVWLEGFTRIYRALDSPQADPVALFAAFDQVDEDGRQRPPQRGRWCPHGSDYEVGRVSP